MKKICFLLYLLLPALTAFPQTPQITISINQIDDFVTIMNTPSAARSYTVQGTNLTGNIFIPGGDPALFSSFEISLTAVPFVSQSINLVPVTGTVPPTTIYVRLHSYHHGGVWDGFEHSSPGAQSKFLGCTGFVLDPEPTTQSTLSFGTRTYNSIVVNMNGGDGVEKLLVARESTPVTAAAVPVDGTSYPWYPYGVYGAGAQLGAGNYIVHAGGARSINVTGLTAGKTYYFTVFDYNRSYWSYSPNSEAEGSQNYLLPANTGSESTMSLVTLPIVVNYLNGYKQANRHLLNWKVTCISTPRVSMELERSADSRNFVTINSITADAVRCGSPFDHTDASPLKGMNYYRLKMTDVDGKVSYSSIVALLNAVKGFDIVNIAPNPVVSTNLNLNVASAQAGKMEVVIVDMQGRLVSRQSLTLIAGFNSLPVAVASLGAGTYSIYAIAGEDRSRTLRFVKE